MKDFAVDAVWIALGLGVLVAIVLVALYITGNPYGKSFVQWVIGG